MPHSSTSRIDQGINTHTDHHLSARMPARSLIRQDRSSDRPPAAALPPLLPGSLPSYHEVAPEKLEARCALVVLLKSWCRQHRHL